MEIIEIYTVQLSTTSLYHHGSPQCHGWLLLRDIHVPHLLTCIYCTLHECGTMQLFYALWWSHACEACSSHGNPNCERVSFVRQQFSLTLEKGDPSGTVEGYKWCRKNRSYTCIAEAFVLHSDCELECDSSTTITQNHAEKLVTIALNIFCSCGLFSVEFLVTTGIKHGSMLNHAWCFAWSSRHVWS